MDQTFRAMVVEEKQDGRYERRIAARTFADLPDGEVLIKVYYSSLNYKDALSATGNKGVTRHYPHTPGIDAAGVVVESTNPEFATGDQVFVTGYDLGMNTSGGFSEYIRVVADWVVPLPKGLSLKESMIYGTAGFTAALCVHKLEQTGITPQSGNILVTGASGGVGSMAVAILSRIGYDVLAASGKPEAVDYLKTLGARQILKRTDLKEVENKPLLAQRWAGVVDTVGGPILSAAIRSTQRHGVVTCCGNVATAELNLTIYPFILRGISLMGADSATSTMSTRRVIWQRLADDWKIPDMEHISSEIGLDDLDHHIEKILKGGQIGRRVVKITEPVQA
jgi:acrylyl-CoA reductase (NADPH)